MNTTLALLAVLAVGGGKPVPKPPPPPEMSARVQECIKLQRRGGPECAKIVEDYLRRGGR